MATNIRLLVDADILFKLALCNLLDEVPVVFDIPWSSIATLPSVRPRAKRAAAGTRDRLFKSRDVAVAAMGPLKEMGQLPSPQEEILATFQDVHEIDAGEAVLFSLLKENPDIYLLTGDKRALRAFASISPEHAAFRTRIHSFENMILLFLDAHGLIWLREHLCPRLRDELTILIVMGSTCTASEAEVRSALHSHLMEIWSRTGG